MRRHCRMVVHDVWVLVLTYYSQSWKSSGFITRGLTSTGGSRYDDVRRASGTRATLPVSVVDNASGAIPGVPINFVVWNSLVLSPQRQAAV